MEITPLLILPYRLDELIFLTHLTLSTHFFPGYSWARWLSPYSWVSLGGLGLCLEGKGQQEETP